jgi:hypothetical protein
VVNNSQGTPFSFAYSVQVRDERGERVGELRGGRQLQSHLVVEPNSGRYEVEIAAADPRQNGTITLVTSRPEEVPICVAPVGSSADLPVPPPSTYENPNLPQFPTTTIGSFPQTPEIRERRAEFVRLYDEKNRLETVGEKKVIVHVGNKDWPFPIPIVKAGERWRFDTKKGKEEILNRRVGENELEAIQTCLAIVDAQREYAAMDRDGDGLLEYARKFESAPGRHDGLYWAASPDEKPSPLGPLVAKARSEGYRKGEKPVPYNGYFFRILTEQGKGAKGGAYSYLVKDRMVGGFAVVAYPATYAVSGVKTFIANHEGIVYQKDLGSKTGQIGRDMTLLGPDKSWSKGNN